MYTLYGTTKSRAMRTLWMLEELDVPYTLVPASPRSDAARAVSPQGKVPALETDEGVVMDSVAQMTFLADRHGRFTHPAGSFARARQDAVTNTILETFDAILWAYAKHGFVLPEEHRVAAVKPSLMWQFARYGTAMGDALGERTYLAGEEPTIPDFLLAHCCGWALSQEFELDDRLRAHMNAMRARPAFRRAVARE